MGRAACTLLVLAGSGCAQILGISNTTGGSDAPPATPQVSLAFQRISVGATVVRAPEDLSMNAASWLVSDATDPSGLRKVPGTLASTKDGWTADIADGTPASEFTLPDPTLLRRLYAFPSRDVLGLYGVFEHPNPEPAPAGSAFAIKVTLPSGYASGEAFQVYAVGPWGVHGLVEGLPAPDVGSTVIGPATVAYDAAHFSSVNGRPLAKLTAADQLVILRHVGNDLTGAGEAPQFDQSGGTDAVNVTLKAVAHAALDVHVQPNAAASRLGGTRPAQGTAAFNWSVVAAPGWQIANNTGPVLNAGAIAAADTAAITAGFGNPFAVHDWRSVFTWSIGASHAYTVPSSMLTMTTSAGLIQLAEVAPALTLDEPQGLPVLISINGMPLNADGLTITLDPTKSVQLALVPDRMPNTMYQFNVYQVVPNTANTALTYSIVYAAFASDPMVTIPNDVLAAGKLYTIRGHCIKGGFPSLAAGNLQDRNLPYAVGYLDSGIFTVAN